MIDWKSEKSVQSLQAEVTPRCSLQLPLCQKSSDPSNASSCSTPDLKNKFAVSDDLVLAEMLKDSQPFNPGPPFPAKGATCVSPETDAEAANKVPYCLNGGSCSVLASPRESCNYGLKCPVEKPVYSHGKKMLLKIDDPRDFQHGVKGEILDAVERSEEEIAQRLAFAFKNKLRPEVTDKSERDREYALFQVSCACGNPCRTAHNEIPGPWTHNKLEAGYNASKPNTCNPLQGMTDLSMPPGMKEYLQQYGCPTEEPNPPSPSPSLSPSPRTSPPPRPKKKKPPRPPRLPHRPSRPPYRAPPSPPPSPPPPVTKKKTKKKCNPFGILAPCCMPPNLSYPVIAQPYSPCYGTPFGSNQPSSNMLVNPFAPLPPTVASQFKCRSNASAPPRFSPSFPQPSIAQMSNLGPSRYDPSLYNLPEALIPNMPSWYPTNLATGPTPYWVPPGHLSLPGFNCPIAGNNFGFSGSQNDDHGTQAWLEKRSRLARCKSPRTIEVKVIKRDCDSGGDVCCSDDCC